TNKLFLKSNLLNKNNFVFLKLDTYLVKKVEYLNTNESVIHTIRKIISKIS
ncbi:unnamed protein product, partial [marine sediment metagenome]